MMIAAAAAAADDDDDDVNIRQIIMQLVVGREQSQRRWTWQNRHRLDHL